MNYFDWIAKWSVYTPCKTAVASVDTGNTYTYKELNQLSVQVEKCLREEYSIQKGDRIAVLACHSPEYLVLFIAAQRMGAILVPLNFRASVPELVYCIRDVEPVLFIVEKEFGHILKPVKEEIFTRSVEFQNIFEQAAGFDSGALPAEIEPEQAVFIFYTSGTTGKPKGVLYTNRMLFWNSLNTSVQLEITSVDFTLNALPPYHTSGWNVLLLPMLHRGARVDFIRSFKPKKVLNYIQDQSISLFLAIPTMLRMMVKNPAFKNFSASKLKYIVVGGEDLSISLIDKWAENGILLRQGYGLTEAGPCITSLHHHDALWKKGSIGKPNFYVDHKIIDDEGLEVEIGEKGELCIRGHIVTPGYWNNSAYTFEKIKDGWFHTGDIVKMDKEGFLYMLGRKNQLFISGGENIYPLEIENLLLKNHFAKEVAVVGVEDENWGEVGVAFMAGIKHALSDEELAQQLRSLMASYKVPRHFIYLDSLPKSGIGKIDRKKLKQLFKQIQHEKRNIS
ncbi:long-chain fatty acid--CoA ligase [Pontixanthobacter gangjinensis]|uniref:Acyl--CoA ligase n=1 Tax=Christiangramia aestuarii TaxID=1028746 RepID=A0A7K1LN32_9FLAO|nr:class I adenylate-forming enzyme family protein [Christiangramia aestuarii]MUP42219.1 acyl--CoA ligase [Christiangramia aestuarii]